MNTDSARLNTTRTKQVMCQISEHLNPRAGTQESASTSQNSAGTHALTQKKTYAEATSTTKRLPGPPRSHHNKTGTKPSPPWRTDFGQLIVDFGSTVQQLPLSKVKDMLNDLFTIDGTPEVRVAGAQFSRKGNLVLSVTPALSAHLILTPA
jgi:hypothetical protein